MSRSRTSSAPLWLAFVLVPLLAGCLPGSSGKDQKNVAPPPLPTPKGEVKERLHSLIPPASVEGTPAPAVEIALVTPDTGLERPLYESTQIVLRRVTAERLQLAAVAAGKLKPKMNVRLLDGARSPEAQRALLALLGDPQWLVGADSDADTRGGGVDVTLIQAEGPEAGQEARMGTRYLDKSPFALRAAEIADADVAKNRRALRTIMEEQGFVPGPCWWDWSDPDWRAMPLVSEADYQHTFAEGVVVPPAESEAESGAMAEAESR